MTVVLGISNSHNGSVAIIDDGKVKFAIQAERISRLKRQALELGKEKELVKKCVQYCLDASNFRYEDIDAIGLSTPWNLEKINNIDLFNYIGGIPENYVDTFYVPHHLSHMEYAVHYGDLEPGIVLVIDGSGSLEAERHLFNVEEEHHSKIINFTHFASKEVISAYWFDGIKSSLIYRFSPSIAPIDKCNLDANGFIQSIGQYWEWTSFYCCGSHSEAGKVMGLAAFGELANSNKKTTLSLTDKGELKLDYSELKKRYKKPNIFCSDLTNSEHYHNLAQKVQSETESVILKLLDILKKKHPTDNLYLSGGVYINIFTNERIKKRNIIKNII